ncbi:MAG: hypothetical protein IPL26_15560 [Leptospiraceae bacterium]|nr:hypothetical protein [Leptospiraceae bacterium]
MGGSKGGGGILPPIGGGDSAGVVSTSASCMPAPTAGTPQVVQVDADVVNGTYKAGTNMKIKLVFSEEIVVTGTPKLTLNNNKVINFSGTTLDTNVTNDTLEFDLYCWSVQEDIAPLDYKATTSLSKWRNNQKCGWFFK